MPRFDPHLICLGIGDRAEMPPPVAVVSAMDHVRFRVSVCSDLPFGPIIFIGFDSKRIRLSTRWREFDRPPGIHDRIVRNDQKISRKVAKPQGRKEEGTARYGFLH
jgi:hypothetical protein